MALEPTKTYFTGFVPRIQDSLVLEGRIQDESLEPVQH